MDFSFVAFVVRDLAEGPKPLNEVSSQPKISYGKLLLKSIFIVLFNSGYYTM
jgi:hypothetical protein